MGENILKVQSLQPLYLSEANNNENWSVEADSSIILQCENVSGAAIDIGREINQIQFQIPVTTKQDLEDLTDIVSEKHIADITGKCSKETLVIQKEEKLQGKYLIFYLNTKDEEESVCVDAGECFQITFAHINAFCPYEAMSKITCIYENVEGVQTRMYVPIYKKRSPLVIQEFKVEICGGGMRDAYSDICKVGMGDEVHISWKTLGADKWQIQPFARNLEQAAGNMAMRIWDSGKVCLRISRKEVGIQKELEFQIQEGQTIKNFSVEPELAAYGKEVKFQWELLHASHAYINNGIGRVEAGSKACRLGTCSGNYVLSALKRENGRNILDAKATYAGQEGVLEIAMLNFVCMGNSMGKKEYHLNWFVDNCQSIKLTTSDGREWAKGSSVGNARFQGSNLTLDIMCEGGNGQKIHYTKIKAR